MAKTQQTRLGASPEAPRAKPILKWVGGKSRLLPQFKPYLPAAVEMGTYYEPFLGSGALFFHMAPAQAVLSDINGDLINVYRVVRDRPEPLMRALDEHEPGKTDAEYFYRVRDEMDVKRLGDVKRAARIIFLNKTCYNGLYRVNRSGRFNTPFGRYVNPTLYDRENLLRASEALRRADLLEGDYREACASAGEGDFVYFDPPYHPLSRTSNFTGYAEGGFTYEDQVALMRFALALHEKGVRVMLSNSSTDEMISLYSSSPVFKVHEVWASRAINSAADRRGQIPEILVTTY